MGLTIFYSGRIRDMRLLPALTEEVKDICNDMQWISGDFVYWPEIPLKGFQFHPPGSEPVWFTFREDGILADPVYYTFKDDPHSGLVPDDEIALSAVTQYGGVDAHMALIKLLRYMSQKYFTDFFLVDESEYWETGDAVLCKDRFEYFTQWMDEMSRKLDQLDGRVGETGETFSERIAVLIEQRRLDEILGVL